jgi:hypothetical protein
MATESRGSNAFGWLVLGFLAGVAATLAALTYISPGDLFPRHRTAPPLAVSAAPAAAPMAIAPAAVVPKHAKLATIHEPTPAQTEQQVQDDAAAAGMTSRRAPTTTAPATN